MEENTWLEVEMAVHGGDVRPHGLRLRKHRRYFALFVIEANKMKL